MNTNPNLFIVGAAKSGTTSLHNYLDQHPDIYMSRFKEPHFLINHEIGCDRIPNSISDEKDYYNLFLNGFNEKYRGESSVMYLMYPEIVIPKINNKFGNDSKIIIMLRNPVDRAYSGYQHVKRFNINETSIDFKFAWDISEERYFSKNNMTPASRHKELGLYYKQVKLYLNKMKNVHIIIYDDYLNDFNKEIESVFDFLGLKHIKVDSNKKHMVGGWEWKNNNFKRLLYSDNWIKSSLKLLIPFNKIRNYISAKLIQSEKSKVKVISNSDSKMLKSFYKNDVKLLSNLLKRDLNYWVE